MQKLEAKYGLFTAISMVIGQTIGSGIFFKADDILTATQGNVFAGLLGFLIVGISVVFAAATMANYAEILPHDGGILNYVEYRFGKKASAYVGWMYFVMFYPLLTAVLFTVSGIYISHFLSEFFSFTPIPLHFALIGFFNLVLFFIINIFRPKSSGIFQQITTVLKLIPLIFIASLGIIHFVGTSGAVSQTFSTATESQKPLWMLVAASFIPVAFSMDGWYVATQISGEIKNPSQNLPKALIIGTIVILTVYVSYYLGITSKMGASEIVNLKDAYINEFSKKIGGKAGSLLMQIFIIISVLGTSNGLLLASIRVPYQFSNLEYSKKFWNLNSINPTTKMPINSAFVSLILIILYLIIYYFTNTESFFTTRNYDISAIPISFIYIVNTALFFGLLKLLKNGTIKGNYTIKTIMTLIAIFGMLVVVIGTATAPNGISYFLLGLIVVASGTFFLKKEI